MLSKQRSRHLLFFLTVATGTLILALALSGLAGTGRAEVTYSPPSPPTAVKAKVEKTGIRVSWDPAPVANPAITHYVVHSFAGSCPVKVSAEKTSAFMPLVKGRKQYSPAVQAVNAYGYSGNAKLDRVIDLKQAPSRSDFRNIQIIHFSDFHGALEASDFNAGAARLATAFQLDRKHSAATFTASSGDSIGGSPVISNYFDEVPAIRAVNKMGLDVSTFGNHEHDKPLSHLREMIGLSRFQWTVANYSTFEPLNSSFSRVDERILLERGGVKVGFVGMNTEDTKALIPPGNLNYGPGGSKELVISRDIAKANAEVRELRKEGAQVVIALLHHGWAENKDGAPRGALIDVSKALEGVDAVYGGHTHSTFASIIKGRPTVEPRNSGQEYTKTQICLNKKKGRVVGSSVAFVEKKAIENLPEDPATAAMVKEYQDEISPIFDQKVGQVAGIFPQGSRQGEAPPPIGAVERSGETQLGNLTADAVRDTYDTDIVFLNGGGIRSTLPSAYEPNDQSLNRPGPGKEPPYDVVLGDVQTIYPFGSNAAVSKMSGEQLWGALEHGVSAYPSGRFPQISGFKFTFEPGRAAGSRVTEVTRADGTPIPKDSTEYSVTTVDYMVNGGDGYVGFFNPSQASIRAPYADALTNLLKANLQTGTPTPVGPLDGRTTCVGDLCVPRTWP